jgi:hypothetical protein
MPTPTPATREQAAALEICLAVADSIRALGSVPAGHLYATVLGHMSLESFEAVIRTLIRSGVVRRDASHLLTWIGPTP